MSEVAPLAERFALVLAPELRLATVEMRRWQAPVETDDDLVMV